MQENNKSTSQFINNLVSNGGFIWHLLKNNTRRKQMFRWINSLKQDYLFNTPSPWLVFDAIDYIESRLFKGMNVFEYGSGGSTLFWLQYGANVVSIEHNPQWYNLMKNKLPSNKSIDYRLIVPEIVKETDRNFDPSDPEKFFSADMIYNNSQFYKYVTQIDEFPDEYFDLISIDGRARPSCIKHSINKVKNGGIIIVDNSDREYYFTKTLEYFKKFSKIEFYGVGPCNNRCWKTNIYLRMR